MQCLCKIVKKQNARIVKIHQIIRASLDNNIRQISYNSGLSDDLKHYLEKKEAIVINVHHLHGELMGIGLLALPH